MSFIRFSQRPLRSFTFFLALPFLFWQVNGYCQPHIYTLAERLVETKPLVIPGNIFVSGISPSPNRVPSHLKEFGFYHSGWDEDDIPEVADFSTFVDVWHFDKDLMEIARKHGLKIWVALAPIFFKDEGKNKQEDYLDRWYKARESLLPFKDIIYAFDPLDEPFQRSLLPDRELKSYLEEISDLLIKDFPSAKRAITFTSYTVNRARFQLVVPENYNLFGVDHYVGVSFQNEIVERLINKTQHLDAKYYLIPRAFKTTNSYYGFLLHSELVMRARQAYDFAISNPKVEVIFPFQWRDFLGGGEDYIGVGSIPELRREYKKIGSAITKDR
ncbi:hypothetical protein [uncultured Microbulbifer sp.]|uniref:hypothetical protein n=1 Tax=uncultured Microbulbifer sp. TaxID=348147 RepID=UPI0026170E01|nr:hypothetical protein [uncultured Microbulbifer sp.]